MNRPHVAPQSAPQAALETVSDAAPAATPDAAAATPAAPAATPDAAAGDGSLLERLLRQPLGEAAAPPDADRPLERFLAADEVAEALHCWLGSGWQEDPALTHPDQLARRLMRDVAQIDRLLGQQLDVILHHPSFQSLEASWRGLAFLVQRADREGDPAVKIKLLSASWSELERDFERSTEFDQSQLFKKVYEQEFGTAGGEPFGVLLGDYAIHPRLSAKHRHDDLSLLRAISGVAASAFCPFLCAASPELLDLEQYAQLQYSIDHAARMAQPDYLAWRSLRESEDARFVGLFLPRVLMRAPYADDVGRVDGFVYREDVSDPDGDGYLWGNPVFAYGAVLIRAFADSGWLADIRGLRQDEEAGGLVTGLPALSFETDSPGVTPRAVTEVRITDRLERELSDLGLVPLCACRDTELAVFASGQSLQKPKKYDRADATVNAKISAMLPYVLTVSRFAHYVKVIARDKIGSFTDAAALERMLHDWVIDYVTADREASPDVKARKPLREASISVQPDPANPGSFHCLMRLAPHYELDEMVGAVRLRTRLGKE